MKARHSSTLTIAKALSILADDLETDDGVINAACSEAAERLADLHDALAALLDICLRMDLERQAERPSEREYQRAIRRARKLVKLGRAGGTA